MEEDENIDKSYEMIGKGLYAGTYIGFNDSSGMNKYQELDLREIYFTVFPNLAALIFAYILGLLFLGIFTILGHMVSNADEHEFDEKDEDFYIIKYGYPLMYFLLCVGHFSYSVYEKFNIYGKLDELANIKADPFLEGLLSEIKAIHPDEIYIIFVIILFCCPLGFSIIFVILTSPKKTSKVIEKTNLLSK